MNIQQKADRRSFLHMGLLAVIFLFTATKVSAHSLGESYLYLQIYEERVSGRFEIALSDLNPALGLAGTEAEITVENLEEHIDFLKGYYLDHVTIFHEGKPLTIQFNDHEVLNAQGGFVLLPFELPDLESVPETLTFEYSVLFEEVPGHRGFLLVEHNWATGTFANENQISLVFSPGSERQEFSLTSSGRLRGFLAVVRLGIEHIWEGLDHLMFLVALLLPAVLRREEKEWREVEHFKPALIHIVKIVTAFTVAHSVTLSLAALGLVRLPGKLVEVVIAASIAIAAFDLLYPIFRGRVWWVVVGFGLFHGFGFAGALSEMGVLQDNLGLALFAFNLGVELGQIVIVAALVPLLFLVRRLKVYRKVVVPAAAVVMILISGVWVAERAFGIDVPMYESLPPAIQKWVP